MRRRRGRGRPRGPRPPAPPAPRRSLWAWFRNLLAPATATAPAAATLSEQEARVLADFAKHYKVEFARPELLKLALTHRSYLSVTGQGPRESNERLEFLGDSVLGLVTSEYLYRQHPNEHEGQLTKTKSLLVSKAILSRRALAMGLGRFVLMSHSEVESGGRQRLSILADAFEAVVGAIYLDQGFEAARGFIDRWLLRDSREISADKRHTNYKSQLQEYVQSNFRTHPVYRIRSEMGPDHSKQFMVEVMVGRRTLGEGKGHNKKEAEQAAARDAIERVRGRDDEPAAEADTAVDDATSRDAGARRRRGRRGGRGRRLRGGAPDAPDAGAEEGDAPGPPPRPREDDEAPAAEREPEPQESGASRRAESAARPRGEGGSRPRGEGVSRLRSEAASRREPRPRVPAPPEIEPPPPLGAEDEDEEIGRPEGPLEERHIDPFAMEPGGSERGAGPAPMRGREVRGLVRPDRGFLPRAEEPAAEEEPVAEDEPPATESFGRGEESRRGAEPAPPAEPSSGSPRFGRRPGKSRR